MRFLAALPALFMIGLSLLVGLGTMGLRYWDGVTPGPAFFPVWLAAAGAFLAVILLIQQFRGHSLGDLDFPDRIGFLRVGATLAAMVGMGLISPILGMVPAVALFIGFMLTLVLRQKLVPSLLTAVGVAVGVEIVFVRWLGVSLPPFAFSF